VGVVAILVHNILDQAVIFFPDKLWIKQLVLRKLEPPRLFFGWIVDFF
jgi:hypothetical protein